MSPHGDIIKVARQFFWRRLEEVLEEVVWRRFSGGGKSLIDLVGPAEYLAAGEYRRPRFCWLTVI
jgi:hypothetical protein